MGKILWNSVLVGVFICIGVTNTVAYSKYGRKCADIGCPSNQVCVMAEDPCNRGSTACGLYPTCQNKALGSGAPGSLRPSGGQGYDDRRRPNVVPPRQPAAPTPPPRISSIGYGGRYPYNLPKPVVSSPTLRPYYGYGGRSSNTIGNPDSSWNRDYDSTNRGGGSGRRGQGSNSYNGGQNNHNTHVATDSNGNRVWTFSRMG